MCSHFIATPPFPVDPLLPGRLTTSELFILLLSQVANYLKHFIYLRSNKTSVRYKYLCNILGWISPYLEMKDFFQQMLAYCSNKASTFNSRYCRNQFSFQESVFWMSQPFVLVVKGVILLCVVLESVHVNHFI